MQGKLTSVWQRVSRPLFVVFVLCSGGSYHRTGRAAETTESWRIEISTAKNTYHVRPDGSGWTEVKRAAHRPGASPDGKHIVYADVPEENKPHWNSEIFVADADRKNARRLTKGEAQNTSPSWTPDGKRIVFSSDRTGKSQIFAMDPDGAKLEQLTREPEGAQMPKLAPDGRLAYLALRKREGKVWFQDLIVRDGAESKAIVQNALLYADFAWRPDGMGIAYGKVGALGFYNPLFGTARELDFAKDIDPQMRSHAAFNLAWRPDGQLLACSIMFLGGRQARGPKMIGDSEVFIIPLGGRPSWFTVPLKAELRPTSIAWVRQHDSRLTAEGHPEWKKLTSLLGQTYDSAAMQNFVRGYSLKSAQKFDEGSFAPPDHAYTLMFRGGKISGIFLHVTPFPIELARQGWIPFSKTLPGGLAASDHREDVIKKLGQPIGGNPNTDRGRDTWIADGLKIWVMFNKDDGSINELLLSAASESAKGNQEKPAGE